MQMGTGMSINKIRIAILVVGVTFTLLLAALAFWAGGRLVMIREICRGQLSVSRFTQLEGMLLSYHTEHGRFPPIRYQASENGPAHSWRVLLLPYIDPPARKVYSEYDFSEPWNSRKNLATIDSLGGTSHFTLDDSDTAHYVAIGTGDEWPSKMTLKARLVTQGEDSFLLVEYPESKIRWMEPKH